MTTPAVPPLLYVPCDAPSGAPEVHDLRRGGRGLVAYTALDRLLDACGSEQPWVLATAPEVDRALAEEHIDHLFLDLEKPAGERRGGPVAEHPLPPAVYVPCAEQGLPEDRTRALLLEHDGGRDLPVYTALDRLRSCLGDGQPWYVADTQALLGRQADLGYRQLLVDRPVTFIDTTTERG